MNLVVNGERVEVEAEMTVRALLVHLGFADTLVAVERNEAVVPRAQHATERLHDEDRIEIVHFVGGG